MAAVDAKWGGHFKVTELGETLIDGTQVSMDYYFKIDDKNDRANLTLVTWHASINCDGDYTLTVKSDVLQLDFADGDMTNSCTYPAPQFEIIKKKGKYYIRGAQFSYSPKGAWIALKKYTPKKGNPY